MRAVEHRTVVDSALTELSRRLRIWNMRFTNFLR
jgi:hypothetical protein